jgi:hypothetical protein
MRSDGAGPGKHFVEEVADFVPGEKVSHKISLAAR